MANYKVETKLVKLALRRDQSYPVGVSAPLHCLCRCGENINIVPGAALNTCKCGVQIDGQGWIK
jgi:hypothetical protein